MDATLQALFAILPLKYQPYAVLLLIALYAVTKWRSSQKSAAIAAVPTTDATKGFKQPEGIIGRLVNFVC